METELIDEKIKKFFELKSKYEEQKEKLLKNKYKKLKEKNFSKKQIKNKMDKVSIPCINCKNKGGTVFKCDKLGFFAKCNVEKPCKLDIQILRGTYIPSRELFEHDLNKINQVKLNIVKTKMKHILNYIDESNAIKSFNEHKKELNSLSEYYYYSKIIFEDIQEEYSDENAEINTNVLEFKKMIQEYLDTQDKIKLQEAIEFQIENIENNKKEKQYLDYHKTEQNQGVEEKIVNFKYD